MNKMLKGSIALTLLCIILGFSITIQFRSVHRNVQLNSTDNLRAGELQVLLNEERDKNASLYQQLIDYKDNLDKFRTQAEQSGGYATALSTQLTNAEIVAGLAAVNGPGVIVTMSDSASLTESLDPNSEIIHDSDIRTVINELCDAGAEAISLNDERLLATSEIRCAGSTVSINNNRYAAPYVIKVIGDPKNLEAALNMKNGVVEVLQSWGIQVSVVKSNNILINAYNGSINFKYATPVAKGGK